MVYYSHPSLFVEPCLMLSHVSHCLDILVSTASMKRPLEFPNIVPALRCSILYRLQGTVLPAWTTEALHSSRIEETAEELANEDTLLLYTLSRLYCKFLSISIDRFSVPDWPPRTDHSRKRFEFTQIVLTDLTTG